MIEAVSYMPQIPQPFLMRNWKKTACDYDKLVFDETIKGDFMPFIWFEETNCNTNSAVFGLPSYINSAKRRKAGSQEGINCIAAVLGASLCGINKQNEVNYVDMLKAYFNSANGENLFLNNYDAKTGGSFWYETYPNILMAMLADCYNISWLNECLITVADKYIKAIDVLGKETPNFNYTSFSFSENKPVYNGKWREPEAAAGYAFVLYTAYSNTKEEKYLKYAQYAMNFLENTNENPFYEIMLPWGALIASRLNGEHGCNYNLQKIVNWCFSGNSACRNGWGVVRERWGNIDCHGLCGSLADWGQRWDAPNASSLMSFLSDYSGYAFAANSFAMPAALVPIARYDTRFAKDIGKWMLNLANNARLFYPSAHSPKGQSCGFWDSDPYDCIAYEGLKKRFDEQSPYATGDPIRYAWGGIDLGLYGSSHVGLMASIISATCNQHILMLDCLKTDIAHCEAYPTYLLYNPCESTQKVSIELPENKIDLYDAVTDSFIKNDVCKETQIELLAGQAIVLVLAAKGETTYQEHLVKRNNIIIKYDKE